MKSLYHYYVFAISGLFVKFCFIFRQWLPRNKLELLGIDKEIDIKKLTECRKQADRKAVRKAYEDALEFRSATTAVLADESPS